MPTFILTNTQKDKVVEALRLYREQIGLDYPEELPSLDTLILYMDNPYSGSWMGKRNIR